MLGDNSASVLTSPKTTTEGVQNHHTCSASTPPSLQSTSHYAAAEHEHSKMPYHHYHNSVPAAFVSEPSFCYSNNCDGITNFNDSFTPSHNFDMHPPPLAARHLTSHQPTHNIRGPDQQPSEYINYSDLKCSTRPPLPVNTPATNSDLLSNEPEFINYMELKHYPHITESAASTHESKPSKFLPPNEITSPLLYGDTGERDVENIAIGYDTCYYGTAMNSKEAKPRDKYAPDTSDISAGNFDYNHISSQYNSAASNYFPTVNTNHTNNSYSGGINNYYDTGPPPNLHAQHTSYEYSGSTTATTYANSFSQMNPRGSTLITAAPCHKFAH